jgi:hypothetical protein
VRGAESYDRQKAWTSINRSIFSGFLAENKRFFLFKAGEEDPLVAVPGADSAALAAVKAGRPGHHPWLAAADEVNAAYLSQLFLSC